MGGSTNRTWPKRATEAWAAWLIGGLLVLSAAACLVKDDERCGPNQTYDEVNDACSCAPGLIAMKGGCQACGDNQEAKNNACVCKEGFTLTPDKKCVAAAAALGLACDASNPCTDATYNHCVTGSDGKGYCTEKGCTKHEDCEGGYSCTTWEAMPYCKKPPTGDGDTCASDADCVGKDATSCDPLNKKCRVAGCTPEPNNCHAGNKCCVIPFGNPMPTVCLAMCPF